MTDNRVHLRPRHRRVLLELLAKHMPDVEVWAYGSRVTGRSHEGSDLDLVLRGPGLKEMPFGQLDDFVDAVRESHIPFLVEAHDWARLPERFRREIEREYVVVFPEDGLADRAEPFGSLQTLSGIADLIMGQSPRGDTVSGSTGVPLLNGPTEFGPRHPEPTKFTSDPRRFAQKGDILFCVRGSTTGRMNWADQSYAIGRGIAALRHRSGLEFQPYLRAAIEVALPSLLAEATGSTFPNGSSAQLRGACVPVATLPEQRAIAHILGTLDDRIELNRRMNATLEAMARALFKSWFVDFDPVRAKSEGRDTGLPKDIADLFPDRLADSELGEIPDGWGVRPVSDVCLKIENGGTPKRKEPRYWGGDIPWFKTGELSDGPLLYSEEQITVDGLTGSACKLWPPGTVLLALYASPTVGRLGLLEVAATANQACCALQARAEYGRFFLFFSLLLTRDRLRQIAVGAAQQNISQKVVRAHRIVVPPVEVVQCFHALSAASQRRRASLGADSLTLAALRDTLLPRLVSGEVRIPDAEQLVAEVS